MKVKITKLAKNPMQSGFGKNNLWIIAMLDEDSNRSINELTGWTSNDDTRTQLQLKFKNKEDAIKYAKEQDFEYVIEEAKDLKVKAKSYASNFTSSIF
jgi:hypothetical protein